MSKRIYKKKDMIYLEMFLMFIVNSNSENFPKMFSQVQ